MVNSCGHEITIELPHITLAAKRWGSQEKPLILALHGWLDNADSFLPLSHYLVDYQIIAIDWPGHGLSEHRPGLYPLHWVDYLYDLDCLLNTFGKAPVILLGHSLGGIIASAYTATFPEKIRQLILIEALSPLHEKAANIKPRLSHSFKSHQKALKANPQKKPVYRDFSVAVNARHKLTALDVAWCEVITQRNMKKCDSGVCWRSDPRLKLDSPLRLTFEQVDALMDRHKVETLLLLGKQGFSQLSTAIPMAHRWFEQLKVETLEGDHHLHMGNAALVARHIRQFLKANDKGLGF